MIRRRLFALPCLMVLAATALHAQSTKPVTIFAAASLKTALDSVVTAYASEDTPPITTSYAGSSQLARQIQYGAPADIFFSANTAWMDLLERDGLLVPGSRVDLLSNQLVLVATVDAGIAPAFNNIPELTPQIASELVASLGDERLAMAMVNSVPAGIYGRQALENLKVWHAVWAQVAQTDNVRAVLRLVATGEAPLGVVYATDALAEPKVRIVATFPADSHAPIIYPVALVAEPSGALPAEFIAFLNGPTARRIFDSHGFGRPGADD